MTAPLQPLRIPPGWQVTYNIFYEVDPSPDTMEWFNESMMLGIASIDGQYFIDLAFHPEDDHDGLFFLEFLHSDSPKHKRPNRRKWTSIGGGKIPTRAEVVKQIEEFMLQPAKTDGLTTNE